MTIDRIILPITPQTNVRSTQGDSILFRIPTDCRKLKGKKPCVKFRRTGECPHILSKGGRVRKKRLQRYNQYKVDLKTLADHFKFEMPFCGWSLYFYIPMPKRWSKKKREAMVGQLHLGKPDIDNMTKAFFDSLSVFDERVAQLSGLGKYWTNKPVGHIEILLNQPIYNPFNVTFIDQDMLKKEPKRRWVKKDTPDLISTRKPRPIKLIEDRIK